MLTGRGWLEGERVVVLVAGQEYHATAGPDGSFVVKTHFPTVTGAQLTYSWQREDDDTPLGIASSKVVSLSVSGARTPVATAEPSVCADAPGQASNPLPEQVVEPDWWAALLAPILYVGGVLCVVAIAVGLAGRFLPWRRHR